MHTYIYIYIYIYTNTYIYLIHIISTSIYIYMNTIIHIYTRSDIMNQIISSHIRVIRYYVYDSLLVIQIYVSSILVIKVKV